MQEDSKQQDGTSNKKKPLDFAGMIGVSERFAQLAKLITRDLNKNTSTPTFYVYSKDDIATYLSNPYTYRKQLRQAITYIYGASSHFRRLIQYFVGLNDFVYVISPCQIDPKSTNAKTLNRNYRKVSKLLSSMNVKTQGPKILSVCLREDVCYCTLHVTSDTVTIQILPFEYCDIESVEGNVPNVAFDFSYFDSYADYLQYYPAEFTTKYNAYQKDRMLRWQELDCPTSFAIKCNNDILDYPLPPFAGILRDVYDLEDYKNLKLSKTALENYALLSMKLPMNDDGDWLLDYTKAVDFWRNLDSVLPEEVGSVLTPMDIEKISFEKSNTGDTDTISEAEQNLFSAAGVSSLLFNNDKASANALLLSIKADQSISYGIVKSIEDAINRYIQAQSFGKNFKMTILDCSPFNRKELGDGYLKACQYGIPMISYYAATQGLSQTELDSMSYLETEVLGLTDMFRPLQSSATISSSTTSSDNDSKGATDEGGAPVKDTGDLSDSGEQSREDGDDWG